MCANLALHHQEEMCARAQGMHCPLRSPHHLLGADSLPPPPVTACSGEHPEEQIAVLFRTHIQARLVEQELVR